MLIKDNLRQQKHGTKCSVHRQISSRIFLSNFEKFPKIARHPTQNFLTPQPVST